MENSNPKESVTASQRITNYTAELGDWRGELLVRLRRLILEAVPELLEEWKWGTPVWAYKGNVLSFGAFQQHAKITFFKGASLDDPQGLINAGLEAKAMRSIDLRQGDAVNEPALQALVRQAAALNAGKKK